MILSEFQSIVNEYFDVFNDPATRKCIVALEDSEQSQLLTALSSALYDKVVAKVDKIDFGSIPRSRGDITKVDGYENTIECLNIMRRLVIEYKQDPTVVDTVIQAIDNVKANKVLFMKAYNNQIELPIVLYNLVVLAIEQSVSFLISVCIQYVKDPDSKDIQVAIDKVAYYNAKDNVIYSQLKGFNDAVANKEFEKSMDSIMSGATKLKEAAEVHDFTANNDVDLTAKKIIIKIDKTDNADEDHEDYMKYKYKDDSDIFEEPTENEDEPLLEPKDVPDTDSEPIHDEDDYSYEIDNNDEDRTDDAVVSYQTPVNGAATVNEITGAGIAGALFIIASAPAVIIKVIIPLLRWITYFFVNSRVKLADMLESQGQFIEYNAYKLQLDNTGNSGMSDEKKAKVIAKQNKIAEKLKKWGNKLSIDNKTATKKTISDVEKAEKEEKKMTIEDIKSEVPEEMYSKSLLF